MPRTTSFDGDLADQETLRAKLKDLETKIERRELLRDRIEDDLEGLERVKQGLLVLLGDKEPESAQARSERLENERKRREHLNHMWKQWEQRAAASIQAQVENLVNAVDHPVSAGDLLEHLPEGTRRETVNWALWNAAEKDRIQKISQGRYASHTFSFTSGGGDS